MSTAAPSVSVRRASIQDASAVLALAGRFVQRSPYVQFVAYDAERARATVLQALDRGVVFVLEEGPARTEFEVDNGDRRIVGAIMGMLTPWWFTAELIAAELGWWVDEDKRGHGDELRRRFEQWAKSTGAPVVSLSDVKLDDAMPNGTLYERAGYEVVERAWLKRLRA